MANVAGIPVYKEIGASPAPQAAQDSARVVIVGACPVGLAMALDLGRRGHEVTVLNRLDFVAHCSKAICFSKRSLDILDRLGVGDPAVDKGVTWNLGKVFWGAGDEPVYQFDMLPVKDQKRPGFINIQQYYIEEYLLDGCRALACNSPRPACARTPRFRCCSADRAGPGIVRSRKMPCHAPCQRRAARRPASGPVAEIELMRRFRLPRPRATIN